MHKWVQKCKSNDVSKGNSQFEITKTLQVDLSIISRDVYFLRKAQAKHNIKKYIDERLPEEYEKCLVGLTAITKEVWNAAHNTDDKRENIQALSLVRVLFNEDGSPYQMLLW